MVKFIVEGTTDRTFIEVLLKKLNINGGYDFLGLEGIDDVKKIIFSLNRKDLKENIYFAFVDADNDFNLRLQEMQELCDGKLAFYIFPNHSDSGDLEALLLSKINSNSQVIDCFDEYKNCLQVEIDNKAKLYAYTTITFNKKPENAIEDIVQSVEFEDIERKLQNLF